MAVAASAGPEPPRAALGEVLPREDGGAATRTPATTRPSVRPTATVAAVAPVAATASGPLASEGVVSLGAEPGAAGTERPEAVLAHAHHGLEALRAHAPAHLVEPGPALGAGIRPELGLEGVDDLVQEPGQRGGLLIGEDIEVVGVRPAQRRAAAGLGEVDDHDAAVLLAGPALDEAVGLELLEQLVEGLLADVEEEGELAGGDRALHAQGRQHPAAAAGGVGEGPAVVGRHVATAREALKAAEALVQRGSGGVLVRVLRRVVGVLAGVPLGGVLLGDTSLGGAPRVGSRGGLGVGVGVHSRLRLRVRMRPRIRGGVWGHVRAVGVHGNLLICQGHRRIPASSGPGRREDGSRTALRRPARAGQWPQPFLTVPVDSW